MVSATEHAIRFDLYSEDRADANQDFTVLRELLLGMLKHLRADLKTNHVDIQPVQGPHQKKRACGSDWKITDKAAAKPGAQQFRRDLIQDVVTAIRLGRVVFFHVDADAVWSRRDTCEHWCDHWPRFRRDVENVLNQLEPARPSYPIEHTLILAMPYYEMESWTFANTSHLRRILVEQPDIAIMAKWEADLARLDEIEHIKDKLTIRDSHNAALVQLKNGFPVAMLAKIPGSYAATLVRLRQSEIVMRGLANAADRPF